MSRYIFVIKRGQPRADTETKRLSSNYGTKCQYVEGFLYDIRSGVTRKRNSFHHTMQSGDYIFVPIQKLLRSFSRKAVMFVRKQNQGETPGEGFSSSARSAKFTSFPEKVRQKL